jgi:hypothetical protein
MEEKVKQVWQDLWDRQTGSTSTALKLYKNEVIALIAEGFEHTSWTVKKQAAVSGAHMTEILGSDMKDKMEELLPLYQNCLTGRIWAGKGN